MAEHRSILKNNRVERILVIFEDRPMFRHIIQKVSARAFIDVAEHRSILKKIPYTHYPRLSFRPKTGIAFPKTGFLFLMRTVRTPWNASLNLTLKKVESLVR